MSSIASPVLPGEILAKKYMVERMLGQGGMGVVVAARHLELDQLVAIKFLVGEAPPNALERFMREARAAALVKSEHVCRVYDFGRLDPGGEPYIVMEYLEGCDLSDKIANEGPQPIRSAVGWIVEACDALSSAHSQGIVHRDLKPANLFLQQSAADGPTTLKVVDFGISKLPTSGALTSTSVMMGSPYYMSPEQLESSRDVDARSDVWSLGVVLYELLTGAPPFNADSLVQLAIQAREKEPERPSIVRGEIPQALEAVILKCLAKKPADRYSNVNAIVLDLAPFAPPEVAALVTKLSKRLTGRSGKASDPAAASPTPNNHNNNHSNRPSSHPDVIGYSKTHPSDAAIDLTEKKKSANTPDPSSGPAEHQTPSDLVGGRTFAPVQTKNTQEKAKLGRVRRTRVLMIGALGLTTISAIAFVASHRFTQSNPGHSIIEPVVVTSSPLASTSSSATTTTATTDLPIDAAPTSTTSSTVPSATTTGTTKSRTPLRPHPSATTSASAIAIATSAAPTTPATSPTASGRKKRELDRDYQPDPKP